MGRHAGCRADDWRWRLKFGHRLVRERNARSAEPRRRSVTLAEAQALIEACPRATAEQRRDRIMILLL